MNICQVIISDGWGGAGEVVYELSRYLQDKGQHVSIILNEEIVKYYTDINNINLFNIGPLYPPQYKLLNMKRDVDKQYVMPKALRLAYIYSDELIRYRRYKNFRPKVKQILADNHIDVIHSHLASSAFLLENLDMNRIPIINTVHGEHDLIGKYSVPLYLAPFFKWKAKKYKNTLSKMDIVTEVSDFSVNNLKEWGVKLKSKPVLIHNGVSLFDFKNSVLLKKKLAGKFNLLYPGGAVRRKGGDLLLGALSRLGNSISGLHLYISGNVPQNTMLRQMVIKLGLESTVTFTGFLTKEEYKILLNSVDLLVMPSREEAFGLAYVEAMALAKPVIASKTGGIPEVVQDGRNGVLVGLDSEQIAKAILYLYQHGDIREEMGRNNSYDVAKFDWNLITDQYICLYGMLVKL